MEFCGWVQIVQISAKKSLQGNSFQQLSIGFEDYKSVETLKPTQKEC